MSDYRVRFQVQQGAHQEVGVAKYDSHMPCSKSSARQKLEELERDAKRFFSDSDWKKALEDGISDAQKWVARAGSTDSRSGKTTVAKFKYKGYEYRVDIEVNGGSGHFSGW